MYDSCWEDNNLYILFLGNINYRQAVCVLDYQRVAHILQAISEEVSIITPVLGDNWLCQLVCTSPCLPDNIVQREFNKAPELPGTLRRTRMKEIDVERVQHTHVILFLFALILSPNLLWLLFLYLRFIFQSNG